MNLTVNVRAENPRKNEELRERVRELRGAPWAWSIRRIADELGISITRVHQFLHEGAPEARV